MLNNNFNESLNNPLSINSIKLDEEDVPCYVYEEVGSTLDVAYELYKEGKLSAWSSVLAFKQSKGRGQLGHNWHSEYGNMYATLLLPVDSFFNTQAIAPIIGEILVSGLNQIYENCNKKLDFEFCLKWTNDLVISSANSFYKIGGILVEEKENMIFAGIGINIKSMPNLLFHEEKHAISPSTLSNFIVFDEEIESDNNFKTCVNTLWERLVKLSYVCYFLKSLSEKDFYTNNFALLKEEQILREFEVKRLKVQQELLFNANKHLAFKNQKVRISNALVFGDFDFYPDKTHVFDYTGTLKRISLEKESLGGIVIDTNYGERIFQSGSIRPI